MAKFRFMFYQVQRLAVACSFKSYTRHCDVILDKYPVNKLGDDRLIGIETMLTGMAKIR